LNAATQPGALGAACDKLADALLVAACRDSVAFALIAIRAGFVGLHAG